MKHATIILFACFMTISGCATPAYRQVFQEKASYNSKEFNVSKSLLHRATARAVCARNFIIDKEDADKGYILAKRSFQKGKKTEILVLQAKMDSVSGDKTTLYLNALQTTETFYVTDRTRFLLFLIPLPGGGGKDVTQVKEGEKAIEDKRFYKSFFNEIEREIAIVSASAEQEKVAAVTQIAEKPQAAPVAQAKQTAVLGVSAEIPDIAVNRTSSQASETKSENPTNKTITK